MIDYTLGSKLVEEMLNIAYIHSPEYAKESLMHELGKYYLTSEEKLDIIKLFDHHITEYQLIKIARGY